MAVVQNTILHAVRSHTGRQRELAQHNPRPARVRFTVTTQGVGETRLAGEQKLTFDTIMLERPTFSFGCLATGPLSPGTLPLGTATVLSYVQNTAGMWVGANVGFAIQSAKYDIKLDWTLTFEALALRSTAGLHGNIPIGSYVQPAGSPYTGPVYE